MNKKARTRKFSAKQSARLGAYLAAGVGASLASSSDAEAAIVFFDVSPDANIPNYGSFFASNINLTLETYTLGGTGGNYFGFYAVNSGMYWSGNIYNAQGPIGLQYGALPLAFGDSIDASKTWAFGGAPYAGGSSPWVSGASTYVGLRLDAGGGNFNYGWVNLTFDALNGGAVVTGFAFEKDLNTAILAGDQGGPAAVPEPGTWAAAALLAGGATFLRWRRRRDEAQKEAA